MNPLLPLLHIAFVDARYQINIDQNDGTPVGNYFTYDPCKGIGCVSADDNSAVSYRERRRGAIDI